MCKNFCILSILLVSSSTLFAVDSEVVLNARGADAKAYCYIDDIFDLYEETHEPAGVFKLNHGLDWVFADAYLVMETPLDIGQVQGKLTFGVFSYVSPQVITTWSSGNYILWGDDALIGDQGHGSAKGGATSWQLCDVDSDAVYKFEIIIDLDEKPDEEGMYSLDLGGRGDVESDDDPTHNAYLEYSWDAITKKWTISGQIFDENGSKTTVSDTATSFYHKTYYTYLDLDANDEYEIKSTAGGSYATESYWEGKSNTANFPDEVQINSIDGSLTVKFISGS